MRFRSTTPKRLVGLVCGVQYGDTLGVRVLDSLHPKGLTCSSDLNTVIHYVCELDRTYPKGLIGSCAVFMFLNRSLAPKARFCCKSNCEGPAKGKNKSKSVLQDNAGAETVGRFCKSICEGTAKGRELANTVYAKKL